MQDTTLRKLVEQEWTASVNEVVSACRAFLAEMKTGGSPKQGEEQLRAVFLRAGARIFTTLLQETEPEMREELRLRGHRDPKGQACSGNLRRKGFKETGILSLFGEVPVRQWTACCCGCGRRVGVWDELLGVVSGRTAACASAVGKAAAVLPYEQARGLLQEMPGLPVDDNRIHRLVAALGPQVQAYLDGLPEAPRGSRPPKGARVYVTAGRGILRTAGGGRRASAVALYFK